jgi:hypothetical protein
LFNEQQRVFDAAVDDVHALHAVARRAPHPAPSRSWAACRRRACRRRPSSSIWRRQAGEQLALLVEHARGVGQQHQLLGLEHLGELAGDHVGVDVVGLAVLADADRGDHRDEGALSRPITLGSMDW